MWKDPNILVGTALYVELLKPAACLSLTHQQKDVDIIFSIKGVLNTIMKYLQLLCEKEPGEWPTLQLQ